MVDFDEDKQNKRLEEMRKKEEEEIAQILASKYGYNYLDLGPVSINSNALKIINEEDARSANLAIINSVAKKIQIAILSPKNEKTEALINKLSDEGYFPYIYMVSKRSLEKAWELYKDISYASESQAGTFDISGEHIVSLMSQIKSIGDTRSMLDNLLGVKQAYRVSKILEIIMSSALTLDASDIHIEPEADDVKMRIRIDGVLLNTYTFDKETYSLMLSRLKLLSGLKLNIHAEPQDGRFTIKVKDKEIEIRSSTLPGAYSESMVMRILNPDSISVPIEELGIEKRTLEVILEKVTKPNGMLLITGPTGSGKTTTLYALMKKIYSPEIKIITIEDPIEYHQKGIVQTQVEEEKGYTFLAGLRSALRQDPDVIMVGEIRDSDTANTAINAALTGHLVFSTLHTNSAAGAFPRLIDLNVNSKTMSSAVSIVTAQRLIRKLCTYCKEETTPTEKEQKIINDTLSNIQDKTYLEGVDSVKIFKSKGCDKCNGTGYKGRVAVCEAILTTKEIEEVINGNPSEREIREAAKPQNLLDMKQDGILKILKGISTLDELGRVIDLEN